MHLISDWKSVLTNAWSMRFIGASLLLSGLEAVMPFLAGILPVQPGTFAILSLLTTCAAGIARIVAQPKTLGEST